MSIFREWLKKKGLLEDLDSVSDFKFNPSDKDFAEDQDRLENELFKTVMRKYPEEVMDFFNTLSQRGDNELNTLLRKLDKNRTPRLGKKPEHPGDRAEIKPPVADSGFSGDSGEM